MAGSCRSPGAFHAAALSMACVDALATAADAAGAQGHTGAIRGRLVDQGSGAPIRGARIALLGTLRGFASDSEGRFARDSLGAGNYLLQVRAIGYTGRSWVLQLAEGQVRSDVFELERLTVQLDPVTVRRPPSFSEPRRLEFARRPPSGGGYFVTGGEIDHSAARNL